MSKKPPFFTWQILDEQEWEAWQRSQAPADPPTAGQTPRANRVLLDLILGLALLAAGVGAYLADDRPRSDPVVPDRPAPTQTPGATASGAPAHLLEVQDGAGLPVEMGEPVAVQGVELWGDLALLEVMVPQSAQPWLPAPYRETRFYRKSPGGWQRIDPPAGLWGPPGALETEHFTFEYRQRDAEAVVTLAGEVEALYAGFRCDLGLGSPQTDDVLTVAIVPELVPSYYAVYRYPSPQRLVLPSPELLPVPAERTAAEVLRRILAAELASQVMGEMLSRAPVQERWQLLISGMLLWHSGDGATPSDQYNYYQKGKALQERLAAGPPLSLEELRLPSENYPRENQMFGIIAAYSTLAARGLIEYVVDGHGRAMLPALVDGLRHHDTWSELIPAVFGVPVAEFEAGWRTYLIERYGAHGL